MKYATFNRLGCPVSSIYTIAVLQKGLLDLPIPPLLTFSKDAPLHRINYYRHTNSGSFLLCIMKSSTFVQIR